MQTSGQELISQKIRSSKKYCKNNQKKKMYFKNAGK